MIPGHRSRNPATSIRDGSGAGSRSKNVRASASAISPIGRLRKKIHRHEPRSTSTPPTTGPTTGANTIATPIRLIARPIRDGPAVRATSEVPTGAISPAPMPCSTRKTTRLPTDQDSPHAIDAIVNSATANIHSRLPPKRSVAQPVSGTTMAVDRM